MAVKKTSARSKRKTVGKKTVNTKATTVFKKVMPSVKDPLTKGGIVKAIVGLTGITKKQAGEILEALGTTIRLHVKANGPGKFVLPGLLKIVVVKKPARPARQGINPFTGEMTTFKAKPAHKVVKIKALRKLKDMALG